MRVSIIIPVYNRSTLLERAIKSVVSQSNVNWELIVVDDGSKPKHLNRIKALQHKYKFNLIRHEKNIGVSKARNSGIKVSKGDFIAFLDSDDEWFPKKLEKQINYFKKFPNASVLYCDEQWIRNGKKVNPPKSYTRFSGVIFPQIIRKCFVGASTFIAKKEVFEIVGLFNEDLQVVEDYEMWIRLSLLYAFHFIPEQLINKYAGHGDQLSFSTKAQDYYRIKALHNIAKTCDLNYWELKILKDQIKTLLNKIEKGFIKRGKTEQLNKMKEWYEEI